MTVSWENHELVPVPLPSESSVGGAGMSILSGNIAHAGGSVDRHWSSRCRSLILLGCLTSCWKAGACSDQACRVCNINVFDNIICL